jgi:serine O-acetyltransferase
MMEDLLRKLRADADRYKELGGWHVNLGFYMGATHRIGAWARRSPHPVLTMPLRMQTRLANTVWRAVWGMNISDNANIEAGLCLIHPRDVWIGPSNIGKNCLVFHDVTVGSNANSCEFPSIGDNVDIYTGAKILGAVKIGDDAKVGANCVVTKNLEAGATVVTAPNRVIPPSLVTAFGPRHGEHGRLPKE